MTPRTIIKAFSRLRNLYLFTLLSIGFLPTNAISGNIMGSDISWRYIGKDSFIITLTIYRDCNCDSLNLPTLNVRCSSTGQLITVLAFSKAQPIDITPSCPHSSCTRCTDRNCSFPFGIERYVFTKLLDLTHTGSCCEILLEFLSERNAAITTGPGNNGFYTSARFNRCLNDGDNSPVFTNPPLSIICLGEDFIFNHGVNDFDLDSNGGLIDSLSFEWVEPMQSEDSAVTWDSSYSYDKPIYFWGFPNTTIDLPRGLHLNAAIGDIAFRPMRIEQSVMSIKVSEYRRINNMWVKIGEIRREIQLIVVTCPTNHAPVLSGPFYKEVFSGEEVVFSIATNDYDANDSICISWNHALPSAIWTDNNHQVKHPTGTLKWTPSQLFVNKIPYVFTVTALDNFCGRPKSSTRAYQILVKENPNSIIEKTYSDNISIFPNPIHDRMIVQSASAPIKRVMIMNLFGQTVMEWEGNNSSILELERGSIPDGLYLVWIYDTEGNFGFEKVLFQ